MRSAIAAARKLACAQQAAQKERRSGEAGAQTSAERARSRWMMPRELMVTADAVSGS